MFSSTSRRKRGNFFPSSCFFTSAVGGSNWTEFFFRKFFVILAAFKQARVCGEIFFKTFFPVPQPAPHFSGSQLPSELLHVSTIGQYQFIKQRASFFSYSDELSTPAALLGNSEKEHNEERLARPTILKFESPKANDRRLRSS